MQKGKYNTTTGRQEVDINSGGGGGDASAENQATQIAALNNLLAELQAKADGGKIVINASVQRPNDTTTYAAGDVVNATSPAVITFTNCARANAGSGTIIGATLIESSNQTLKGIFELWLFDTTVTADSDNAVFTPTDAELATLVGIIPFDVSYVGDATANAGGNAAYTASILNLPFVTGAESRNLFGVLVVRNAYVPVADNLFTMRLNIAQD